MSVTIGALRESAPQETRVSLVPEVADKLAKDGARVLIERGAGERAGFPTRSIRVSPGRTVPRQVLRGGRRAADACSRSASSRSGS